MKPETIRAVTWAVGAISRCLDRGRDREALYLSILLEHAVGRQPKSATNARTRARVNTIPAKSPKHAVVAENAQVQQERPRPRLVVGGRQ